MFYFDRASASFALHFARSTAVFASFIYVLNDKLSGHLCFCSGDSVCSSVVAPNRTKFNFSANSANHSVSK